jgi:hypothetical protein
MRPRALTKFETAVLAAIGRGVSPYRDFCLRRHVSSALNRLRDRGLVHDMYKLTAAGKIVYQRQQDLTWTIDDRGVARLGDYWVDAKLFAGTRRPFVVGFQQKLLLRAHGACTGYQRFVSMANAKRWVEKRIKR